MKTISILGCGWLGLHLAPVFQQQGMHVKGSTTTESKIPMLTAKGVTPYLLTLPHTTATFDPDFFSCDILLIAIPPKARQGKGEEYLQLVTQVIEAIQQYPGAQVLFASSTSVYGSAGGEITELTPPAPDTPSGHIMLQAEQLLRSQNNFTTTVIRFGGLTGPDRHPGRFLAGKQEVAGGLSPVNLIHSADCAGICLAIIQEQAFGYTINACSPHHPPKQDFYTRAAVAGGFIAPTFKQEGREAKIISSIYTTSLLHYRYVIDNWYNWL